VRKGTSLEGKKVVPVSVTEKRTFKGKRWA
jgi:hypothetical protein